MANAPAIGVYNPEVNAQESMPRRAMPQAANVSNAAGLEAVGSALNSVSQVLQNKEQQDGAAQASNILGNARANWTKELINRQTNYQAGEDFTGKLAKDFNDYSQQQLATLKNPYAQKFATQQLQSLGQDLTNNAVQFQARQQVETRINNWSQGAEQAKVAVSLDPFQFEKAYGEQLATLNELQIGQSAKDNLAAKLKADMAYNASEALAKANPDGVLKQLQQQQTGSPALDRLSVEQRGQITDFANAEIRQREADKRQKSNELAADTKARITDLSASYRAGLPVDPKQELTPGQLEAAFPGQGKDLWQDLQKDKRMGIDLKSMATQSPQELAATLGKYEVTQGGEGAQDALMRQDEVRKAAIQSLTERQKDPRAFAVENGINSRPINFADPQSALTELSSRAANADRTNAQVGFRTPILSADEAKQLNQTLMTSPPDQRAAWLGAMNQRLGDGDAYQSIMKQVLPMSPVTSMVGSRIGQNNPKTAPAWFDHTMLPANDVPAKILTGEQLLTGKAQEKDGFKGNFPMPSDGGAIGLREQFNNAAGDMFKSRPGLADGAFATYKAAYAALAAEKGDVSGQFNHNLSKQALQMALGNTITFRGSTIAVPDGMQPDRFKGLVSAAVKSTAEAAGAPKDWADRISGYGLREIGGVGSGQYQLVNGNAVLQRPDNKGPFVINLRQQYGQQ